MRLKYSPLQYLTSQIVAEHFHPRCPVGAVQYSRFPGLPLCEGSAVRPGSEADSVDLGGLVAWSLFVDIFLTIGYHNVEYLLPLVCVQVPKVERPAYLGHVHQSFDKIFLFNASAIVW